MKQNRVAVTGGFGSGKSEAMNIIKEAGYAVVSSDAVSRAVAENPAIVKKIVNTFGEKFVNEGKLLRKQLAEFVFGSDERTKRLNSIMHPAIFKRMRREIRNLKNERIVFVEVPLLIESGKQKYFDTVWLITAPEENRIARAMQRDGLTEQEIKNRMAKQLPDEKKRVYAHTIITNDKSFKDFKAQILENLQRLKETDIQKRKL